MFKFIDGEEKEQIISSFSSLLDFLFDKSNDEYYSKQFEHVSQVSHPCPLYNYKKWQQKKKKQNQKVSNENENENENGKMSDVDSTLVDWFLKVGTLIHAGFEQMFIQKANELKSGSLIEDIEVEKELDYDVLRDCIADEDTDPFYHLKGKCDLLIKKDNVWWLIDWKTTRKERGTSYQYNQTYINQVMTYAHILRKMNYDIKYILIIFINLLKDDIIYTVMRYDEKTIQRHRPNIIEFLNAIKEKREPQKCIGAWCYTCPFRRKCLG
jgi:predicted RecB family nuclease